MNNFCGNCGTRLKIGNNFCTECGTPVKKISGNHPAQIPRQDPNKKKCPLCNNYFPAEDILCLKCFDTMKDKSREERLQFAEMLKDPKALSLINKMKNTSLEEMIEETMTPMVNKFMDEYSKTEEGQEFFEGAKKLLDEMPPFMKHTFNLIRNAPDASQRANLLNEYMEGVRKGNVQQEIGVYKQLIEYYPNDLNIWIYLITELFAKNNMMEEALDFTLKSISKYPNIWFRWAGLGTLYIFYKNHTEAINCFHKVLELKPDQYESYLPISECHYELGNKEEALKYINKSLNYDPNNARARALQQKIISS